MFMVLIILDDRCRVKHLSQFRSQSIYLRTDVPLLLELFWCNFGSSRRKEKRIERFPDKILGCEIQANVKWSLSICTPEKEFKAENKTQTNLNHTCWVTLGPQWNQRMLCCSTEMPASSSSWTVDKLPPPELLTNFCSDTEQTLAWQSRENTI